MRILSIGYAVGLHKSKSGQEWDVARKPNVNESKLNATGSTRVYDSDFFVVDCVNIPLADELEWEEEEEYEIQGQIAERIRTGAPLICFAADGKMGWLPVRVETESAGGTEIDIAADTPFTSILSRLRRTIRYETTLRVGPGHTVLATNKARLPVAAAVPHDDGLIILLPYFEKQNEIIDAIITEVIPSLGSSRVEAHGEVAPKWIEQFPIKPLEELRSKVDRIDRDMAKIVTRREKLVGNVRGLEQYYDLLWQKGRDRLEAAVRIALGLLGIEAQPQEPVDLLHEFGDEVLLVEIEGTEGVVQVAKGAQLLRYVSNYLERYPPKKVHGAIIGNPYRLEPPDNRPPKGKEQRLFSKPLADLAEQQQWRLITTVEIFALVKRHLEGDSSARAELREKLRLPAPSPTASPARSSG